MGPIVHLHTNQRSRHVKVCHQEFHDKIGPQSTSYFELNTPPQRKLSTTAITMQFTPPILLLSSLIFPLLVSADPVAQAVPAQQTIVPFSTLPACSQQCGKLYDVQGACSPPQVDASNTKTCFCADSRLTPFNSGTTGVCDQAQCDAASLTTIQKWYQGLCGTTNAGTAATTTSSTTAKSTATSAGNTNSKSNGDGTWFVYCSFSLLRRCA